MEPGVDHLHPGVAQHARDDLRAAVVPVEAGLGHDHADLAPALRRTRCCLGTALHRARESTSGDLHGHPHHRGVLGADDRERALLAEGVAEAAAMAGLRVECHALLRDHVVKVLGVRPVPAHRAALLDRHRAVEEVVVAHADALRPREGDGGAGQHSGDRQEDEELAHQNTGVSVYVPNTVWSASTISPSVAWARAQSSSRSIRFWSPLAACLRAVRAAPAASLSRAPRTAFTRSTCFFSSFGSMRRISIGASSRTWWRLTPTTTRLLSSTSCWYWKEASAISRCGKFCLIACTMPPSSSMRAKYSYAAVSISSVSVSTK